MKAFEGDLGLHCVETNHANLNLSVSVLQRPYQYGHYHRRIVRITGCK